MPSVGFWILLMPILYTYCISNESIDYLWSVVLAVEVVELERGRMMQFRTGPSRWQTFQERIVNREIRVVFVQQPDSSPLNGKLDAIIRH